MSSLFEAAFVAMREELKKEAGPRIQGAIGSAGALAGMGAGIGGLIGGGVRGVRAYRDAREQGESRGHASTHALLSGLGGAAQGAVLGAGVGGLTGAGLGAVSPRSGEALRAGLTKAPIAGELAQYGQRQAHSVTGWTPKGGLKEIGLGASMRKPSLDKAQAEFAAAKGGKDTRGRIDRAVDKVIGRSAEGRAKSQLSRAQSAYDAAKSVEDRGLTSLPGYAKGLAKDPLGTVGSVLKDQWAGSSLPMKALTVGLPAYELAKTVRSPEGPDEAGRGRGERIGRSVANIAAGTLGAPLTMTTQAVLGGLATRGGGKMGRIADKPKGTLAPGPDLVNDGGPSTSADRTVTERASSGLSGGVL